MNVFGPREQDPLLQDDPFAPENQAPAEDDATDASPSSNSEAETSCLLLGSLTDAQEGKLTALNRALANGWTLERVELRPAETLAFVLRRPAAEPEASEQEVWMGESEVKE